MIEAEAADLTGDATIATPNPAWTGESSWSGRQVVAGPGATLGWTLPTGSEDPLVQPVLALEHGSDAVVDFTSNRRKLGAIEVGAVGAPGDSASNIRLTPVKLNRLARPGDRLVASVTGGQASLDALLVMPEVATLRASGGRGAVLLLTSKSNQPQSRRVRLPGSGRLRATSYDRNGRRAASGLVGGNRAMIAPGGFTVVTRG